MVYEEAPCAALGGNIADQRVLTATFTSAICIPIILTQITSTRRSSLLAGRPSGPLSLSDKRQERPPQFLLPAVVDRDDNDRVLWTTTEQVDSFHGNYGVVYFGTDRETCFAAPP